MPFPSVTDIVATTIERRSKKIQDNVTKNNALLTYIKDKGNVRTFSGGSVSTPRKTTTSSMRMPSRGVALIDKPSG